VRPPPKCSVGDDDPRRESLNGRELHHGDLERCQLQAVDAFGGDLDS